MAEENYEKVIDGINKGIENIKEQVSKKADAETIQPQIDEVKSKLDGVVHTDNFKKQQDQVEQLETEINQLKERQGRKEENPIETLEKDLKGDEFKNFKQTSGKKGMAHNIELKTITTSDINSGSIRAQYEQGVDKHPWQQTPLFDMIPKGTIGPGRDSISWWERASTTDNSEAGISEGSKPAAQSAASWNKQSLDIVMIGDYMKMSRTALEDWEHTRDEILDLINNQVPLKIESELLSGSNLTGLIGQAKAFAKPDNFDYVSYPNYIDAIRAVALQIMNGNTSDANKDGYMPNMNLVNSGVLTNMRGMKDANGSYIIPPLSSFDTNVDGIRHVPSSKLSSDTYLMGDITRAKMFIKRAMEVRFYYENEDDALKDLVTVHAFARVAGVKVATPHKFAFATGTFTAATSAITEPAG
ncbi:MAG: phage major capsid protein [Bacteroidales bacterium]|nr:phage major capsid protein [Bacteroidales bacterium]